MSAVSPRGSTLAYRDEHPLPPVARSTRPTNGLVMVADGDVSAAIRALKKMLGHDRIFAEVKRRQFYTPPGLAARLKSHRARRVARKAARRAKAFDAREEARGR